MDTALALKIGIDKGHIFSEIEIQDMLCSSALVKELTTDLPDQPLSLVWRLIGISEIPFGYTLDYTKQLIANVYEKLGTPFGFSLSGDEKGFLPCYNAMIASALCRLGRSKDLEVRTAIEWIDTYRPMQNGQELELPNFSFKKYGGCFNNTPCYIGLAKAVFALQAFKEQTNESKYDPKLQKGISYMLEHKFYKRLSNGKPITQHITDLSFPESYHLNVVELLMFASKTNLLANENATDLVNYINKQQTATGNWINTFKYKADGYVIFDKGRTEMNWTTQIIKEALRRMKDNK